MNCINVKIPSIIDVDYGVIKRKALYLNEDFSCYVKVLVTSDILYEKYKREIDFLNIDVVYCVVRGDLIELNDFISHDYGSNVIFYAFGGGTIIDFTKVLATKCNVDYITIPTTVSNDAIYSPIARILVNGEKESLGVRPPVGILGELNVISRSPKKLLLAGIGDLVSNLSAIKDWEIASLNGETIHSFANALSFTAASSILNYSFTTIYDDKFLRELTYSLIYSGLSMVIAGSSRSASGSEHLMSHTIDKYYKEKSTLHGIQVAFSQLIIEKYVRKNFDEYNRLKDFFDKTGVYDEICQSIKFSNSEIIDIMRKSLTIRNRYTILNEVKFENLLKVEFEV